jgi:hypothetical protein
MSLDSVLKFWDLQFEEKERENGTKKKERKSEHIIVFWKRAGLPRRLLADCDVRWLLRDDVM